MSMYNKIFTKILDSSIWLEPTPTRIVWITMIAAMDENGFCQFAAVGNVAGRARVTEAEARTAIQALEGPDPESSDQENEGRRIERVPGGWMVLNAPKYRALVTRVNIQEKTQERVHRYREKKRKCNAPVTQCNAPVTRGNDPVTPSDSVVNTKEQKPSRGKREGAKEEKVSDPRHTACKERIFAAYRYANGGADPDWDGREGKALGMLLRAQPALNEKTIGPLLNHWVKSDVNHGDRPSIWIPKLSSFRLPIDRFNKPTREGNGDTRNRNSLGKGESIIEATRQAIRELDCEGVGDAGDGETGHGGFADPEILRG